MNPQPIPPAQEGFLLRNRIWIFFILSLLLLALCSWAPLNVYEKGLLFPLALFLLLLLSFKTKLPYSGNENIFYQPHRVLVPPPGFGCF